MLGKGKGGKLKTLLILIRAADIFMEEGGSNQIMLSVQFVIHDSCSLSVQVGRGRGSVQMVHGLCRGGGGNAWPGPCSFSTSINMLNKFVFCNFRTMDAEESTTTTATRTTDPGTTIDQ